MTTSRPPGLRFGGFDLLGPDPDGRWECEATGPASGGGTGWGTSEPIVQVVESFLADGAIMATTGQQDRDLVVTLRLTAPDLGVLADAEAALVAECRAVSGSALGTLTWSPPDEYASACVFEVTAARLDFALDDYAETQPADLGRSYTLTLKALPFARSADPVRTSIPAPPAVVVETAVDDGSTLAGWTANPTASTTVDDCSTATGWAVTGEAAATGWTVTAASGGVRAAGPVTMGAGAMLARLSRTGLAVDASVRRYVSVQASWTQIPGADLVGVVLNGITAAFAARVPTPGGGVRAWYLVPASVSTINTVDVMVAFPRTTDPGPSGPPSAVVSVWDVGASPAPCDVASLVSAGGRISKALSVMGAADQAGNTPISVPVSVVRSGLAVDLTDTPYLRVTRGTTTTAGAPAAATLTGIYLNGSTTPARVVATSGTVSILDVSDLDSLATVKTVWTVRGDRNDTALGAGVTAWVDDLTATNVGAGPATTNRELSRTVPVAGAVRTPASLTLHDDTPAPLGTTLVYTSPVADDMVQPPLRPYLDAGPAVTADPSTCSGATSPLSTAHVFDVPAVGMQPGGHLLLARVMHSATGTYPLAWSATTLTQYDGTWVTDTGQAGTLDAALTAGTWTLVPVAGMVLPTSVVGPNGLVRVTLSGPAGVVLDNAYLCNLDTGQLSIVECDGSRLWLDSASAQTPVPRLWVGGASGRGDAIGAGDRVAAQGLHRFEPPAVNVFTVTAGSTACAVDLEAYPRWHTHVGTVAP